MIVFEDKNKVFHLNNEKISYIFKIDENGHLLHLYFGKNIHFEGNGDEVLYGHLRDDFFNGDRLINTYVLKEYGSHGTGDFRAPAFIVKQENGSHISDFCYKSHKIYAGKKPIEPLPATYVESEHEAETLEICLHDRLTNTDLILFYSIYKDYPVIARHSEWQHKGNEKIYLERAMSLQLDLTDKDYEFVHFSGAWGREKHIKTRRLEQGTQSIHSTKGVSSAEHNPSFILKRTNTDENSGEAMGFALLYSGNFLAEIDVDSYNQSRVNIGICPLGFSWQLSSGDSFTTPEAVMIYSDEGLGKMSQNLHKLFAKRLCRGKYRDEPRPILLNNWEATEMDFDEEKIISIAKKAKEAGVELFVLDDGWFGKRNDEMHGLGDWFVNTDKLPSSISGLSKKVKDLGMGFGLWFEPEMVNKDSDLYREHPEFLLSTPNRKEHSFRYQHVLDFSRADVVDYIYKQMHEVIASSYIDYIKWDMNRYFTEVYSTELLPEQQGEVMHRYVLGVYELYARLIKDFPNILFESCSSGGARFDHGLLYYAPQTWTSDNTDGNDRVCLQYASSFFYPISSHGAHVSAVPNAQTTRSVPLSTRANVAYFGAFGYELDLNEITEAEFEQVKQQIVFYKKHREVFQYGKYYRLISPFENNAGSFMTVSEDGKRAFVLYYNRLFETNTEHVRLRLKGLEPKSLYNVKILGREKFYYGDYLMNLGIAIDKISIAGLGGDFTSLIIEIVKQ